MIDTYSSWRRLLTIVALALSPAVHAAEYACSVLSRGESMVVLVCPKGTTMRAWRDASVQACTGMKPCNAWIWDDRALAPPRTVAKEADIPRAAADRVTAVWLNDAERFLQVKKN